MLKHVLVPLDGSQLAEQALGYVSQIVDPNVGSVTLLSVLDVPDYPIGAYYPSMMSVEMTPENVSEKMMPRAQSYLEHHAESLRAAGYVVDIEVVIGEPASMIVELAEEKSVDAIVMSTHGRSGLSRWIFGSVANKVLIAAPCPVFIVPMSVKSKAAEAV